jgi:hypothetical protein
MANEDRLPPTLFFTGYSFLPFCLLEPVSVSARPLSSSEPACALAMECPDFVGAIDDKKERTLTESWEECQKSQKKNSRNIAKINRQVRAMHKDVTALGTA